MILIHEEQWNTWNITNPRHRFFVLRWQEIFGEETFDSWQVRYSNVKSILRELSECIDIAKISPKFHKNIECLLDELQIISKEDTIIQNKIPGFGDSLKLLENEYKKSIKDDEIKNIYVIKKISTVLLATLKNYKKYIIEEVKKELLSEDDFKKKGFMYKLVMLLGTELTKEGYPIKYLRDIGNDILFNKELNFIDRFDKLIYCLDGKEKSFLCEFHVSWPKNLNAIETEAIKIKATREEPTNDEETKFFELNSKSCIAEVNVNALDKHSAIYLAQQNLESFFSACKIYILNKQISILRNETLITDDFNISSILSIDDMTQSYIKDAKKSEDLIFNLFRILTKLNSQDQMQLSASLQYHKLFISATNDESKLINLWIAIESITQEGGNTIIDRICKYISKSNSTNYIYKICKSFSIETSKLWRKNEKAHLLVSLKKSNERFLHLQDFLSILLDSEDGILITSFYEIIKDNPLLTYKTHIYRKLLSGNQKDIGIKVENHRKNIEWQLKRIYRERNHITHRGKSINGCKQLIQNLHTYYINTIHNITKDISLNDNFGIGDSLEYRAFLYDITIQRLKSNACKLSCDTLLQFNTLIEN